MNDAIEIEPFTIAVDDAVLADLRDRTVAGTTPGSATEVPGSRETNW